MCVGPGGRSDSTSESLSNAADAMVSELDGRQRRSDGTPRCRLDGSLPCGDDKVSTGQDYIAH